MQCSSLGCSLAQWKDKRPWRPEFGPEGKHFVSGNSLFYIFGGAAKLRWGGRAAPVWRLYEPKKTGARSARARTRGQIPTSLSYIYLGYFVCVCVCVSQFVSERSAILLVLVIKLTNQTRWRVWRGRDRDGEIWKGTDRRGRVRIRLSLFKPELRNM